MVNVSLFSLLLFSWVLPLVAHTGYEEIADRNELKIRTSSLSSQARSKIRLDNGMEVLLISDPQAIQSAASLCVEVGSWSDPTAYPGMAHFVEHLIFLGSYTYPEEGSYFKQVTQGGGMLNAFTTSDRTVYTFAVNHDAFLTTLDYFSHMFTDPLFSQSGIRRELHAIDQEYDKNIENEYIRTLMVMRETGNPHHPNARFAAGNASTLESIPNTAIIKWYQEHYSAEKAHLIIYSPETPDTLKELAVAHFAAFPLNPSPGTICSTKLTIPEQEGKMTYITPIREVRELGVRWELPQAFFTDREDSSITLLSYILSSQHRGSLYHQLREEQLIENLSARLQPLSKDSGFYTIDFVLTPRGVEQRDAIYTRLFESLKRLKTHGIPRYIFEEAHKTAQLAYEYQRRVYPFEWVSELAYYMAEEPIETFPQKLVVPATYSAEKALHFLRYLEPERAQYSLKAPRLESGFIGDRAEKWSGAEYTIRNIDSLQMKKWSSVRPGSSAIYPEQNPYIPSNFDLVTKKQSIDKTAVPQVLIEDEYGKVYYWEDERYLAPEVAWIISFKSPHISIDARQLALCDLFEKCLSAHLTSAIYYARAAGLNTAIKIDDCKLNFYVHGFHQHALAFLEVMLDGLKSCTWTKEAFEMHRRLLMADYGNFRKLPSHYQGWMLMKWVVLKNYPREDDKILALQKITYEDFLRFKTDLLEQMYGQAMLTGNLTKKDSEQVWQTVRAKLGYAPFPKEKSMQPAHLLVPRHLGPCKLHQKINSLGHSAVLVLQNDTFSLQKSASVAILEKGMAEDFFDTLRTKQQIAYIAKSHKIDEDEQLCQVFLVQSSTHKPDELIDRFELFLEGYVKDFESKISRSDFQNIRDGLVAKYKRSPENLAEMAHLLYHLGFKRDSNFHYIEEKIDAILHLDYDTFKQNSLQCLSRKNPRRIALMLEGDSPEGKDFSYKRLSIEELKSRSTRVE